MYWGVMNWYWHIDSMAMSCNVLYIELHSVIVCSVVENMPPVVLTDEEICLEVVERSDRAR